MARVSASAGLRPIGFGLALVLASAAPATPVADGARREAPPIVVPITTELVQVDAVVTDGQNRQVTDLTAEDFEIVEDGKRRPITHFRYVAFEPTPAAAPAEPAALRLPPPSRETTKRTLVIVFDDLSLSFEGQVWARRELHRMVAERIGAGDLVSVVRTGGGIGNLQQFTNDKRLLDAAIDGVRFNLAGRGELKASLLRDLSRREAEAESRGASPERLGAAQSPEMRQLEQRIQELVDRAERARQVGVTLGALTALELVVQGLERMPGRKSLLLVSEGLATADEMAHDPRVRPRMRQLLDAAHRAAVVIYAVDPVGLRTYGGSFGGGVKEQWQHVGLNDLAEETGGLALLTSNDLYQALTRIDEDQKGYYLIGYQPDEGHFLDRNGQPRFHRLKLAVNRKGLRVRSRRGFYARPETAQTQPRATGFLDALFSPFPAVEVPVRLTALFSHHAKRGALVRCLLRIDAEKLTFSEQPDGRLKAELDAGVVIVAASGRRAGSDTRTYTVSFTPDAVANARRNGLLLALDLPIQAGPHQIRAAVWERQTSRGGSAYEFLDVPDVASGRLALSGLVMTGASDGSAPPPVAGAEEADAQTMDPNATPAVRRFRPGSPVAYAFAVYNARREAAGGEPRLNVHLNLYRDGTRLEDLPAGQLEVSAPSAEAPVAVGGRLRLSSRIEPGEYTLEVIVLDAMRGAKGGVALERIDFEVGGS